MMNPQLVFQQKWPLFTKYQATEKFTFNSMGEQTRTTPAPIMDTCSLEMIPDNMVRKFDETPTFSKQKKLMAPYLDFVVEPKMNDMLMNKAGSMFEVREVSFDPFKAVVTLTVRPTKE